MAGELVLITGATGHLGFRVLLEALKAGYHVRAAVRNEQKAAILRSNAVLQASPGVSNLSYTIVPDFLHPNAFDEAAKDTEYIIHVASPLLTKAPEGDDLDAHFVQPAVKGTLSILESARKAASVRRIVITSSVLGVQPITAFFPDGDGKTYSAESRLADMKPPYINTAFAYAASKVAALNHAEAWIKAEQPSFDVIHIHPSFIFGRDDLATSTEYFQTGTNRIPLNIALGKTDSPLVNNWNDVADTANIHVLSLDPKVPGNQSFLATNDGRDEMRLDDVKGIVSHNFPEAVQRGDLPNDGSNPSFVSRMDISKTEDTFGLKLATYEETISGMIGNYLELLEKEKIQSRSQSQSNL